MDIIVITILVPILIVITLIAVYAIGYRAGVSDLPSRDAQLTLEQDTSIQKADDICLACGKDREDHCAGEDWIPDAPSS